MGSLQWPLFFMCFCYKVTQTEESSWTIQVPSSVQGLTGSCVVIPCSYAYPDPRKGVSRFTGIWYNKIGVIFHTDQHSQIQHNYQDRTKLLGDISKKNCSLMIDKLQQSDQGPFHFRIEGHDSYSFNKNKVYVNIISIPDPINFSVQAEVNEGQSVSASCSVSFYCPTHTPAFNWSHTREQHFQVQQLNNSHWKATSTLTFHSNRRDHKKLLGCKVTYHGGKHQEKSDILQVKYAPVNVKIEYKSNVTEGETVHLKCSSDAHPPVSSYEWHNETGALLYQGKTYTMSNVSRYSGRALYCTAINEQGRGESNPVQLNVLYAPDIKPSSKCYSEGDMLKCECIIESNPASMVTFVVTNRTLQSNKEEKNGSITTATVQMSTGFKLVHCLANNSLGNSNLTLSLPFNHKKNSLGMAISVNKNILIILIASGAGVIILIPTGVAIVKKCRGRSGDTPISNLSTNRAVDSVELPPYERTKRKENYEDVHCPDIYANDHVYGNTDSVYTNM